MHADTDKNLHVFRKFCINVNVFLYIKHVEVCLWVVTVATACCCLVAKSCPTFCDPMDYSPPSLSLHGIFQTRILEWVATSFSRGSSWPGDWTHISCISSFTTEPPGKPTTTATRPLKTNYNSLKEKVIWLLIILSVPVTFQCLHSFKTLTPESLSSFPSHFCHNTW